MHTNEEGAMREPSPIACGHEAPVQFVSRSRDSKDGSDNKHIRRCEYLAVKRSAKKVSYVALFAGGGQLPSVGRPRDA